MDFPLIRLCEFTVQFAVWLEFLSNALFLPLCVCVCVSVRSFFFFYSLHSDWQGITIKGKIKIERNSKNEPNRNEWKKFFLKKSFHMKKERKKEKEHRREIAHSSSKPIVMGEYEHVNAFCRMVISNIFMKRIQK